MTYNTTLLFAHAFGQRYELPIPLLLFIIGGALVVFLSFLFVVSKNVNKTDDISSIENLHVRPVSAITTALSLVALGLTVVAGLAGSQEVAENIVPTLFWLFIWIAVPLSCGLIGDWTQQLNPFANIAKLTDSNKARQLLLGNGARIAWPTWLGWWPATVLFFILASGELIYNQTATLPAVTASGLIAYFVMSAVMGFLFGDSWLKRGEVFTVLFSTWGKLGFFRFGAQGQRGFGKGLTVPFEASFSRIAFVLLLLVSVSFDGLLATPGWSRFQLSLPDAIQTGSLTLKLLITAAFVVLAAVVWLTFSGFAAAVVRAGRLTATHTTSTMLAGLMSSLVPISFGYLLAHNLEYLIVNGQLLFPLIGNPTGQENWLIHLGYPFNDSYEPNIHVLPSSFYWYLSVVVIIAVHIGAVVLAHRYLGAQSSQSVPSKGLRKAQAAKHGEHDSHDARRSEYPWIAAMVIYTMLSLWLLAQPLVQEKAPESGSKKPNDSGLVLVRIDANV